MAQETAIQWCDSTCNPTMGCDGCELWDDKRRTCYAGKLHETRGKTNKGFAPSFDKPTPFPGRMAKAAAWSDLRGIARSGKPWLDGAPRLTFVSDMGDSLSRDISFDYLLAEVVNIAESARGKRHIWQWLTKRPARMAKFSEWLKGRNQQWPTNLWVGTSITNASTLARVASLLSVGDDTTTRFLSVEPQIESVDLGGNLGLLDWIIQGGESGRDARPFDLAWARELNGKCQEAGVPYFLKQLGAVVVDSGRPVATRDTHGGDWSEWPDDLRVRQIPHDKAGRRMLARALYELESGSLESSPEMSSAAAVLDSSSDVDTGKRVDDEIAPEHDGVEVDPQDGRAIEGELERLISCIADEMSELALIKLLPRAKELYERLHPETRHGGRRDEQVARSATWPSFAGYVASRAGISQRSIYNRLEKAELLATLDSNAEAACYGCAIANQIRLLVRVAQVPDSEVQRDIVTIYRNAGPKKAKEELQKREGEFGIASKTKPKPRPASAPSEPEQPDATDADSGDNAPPVETELPDLTAILAALGVNKVAECVHAIESLKVRAAAADELRGVLAEQEKTNKRLEKELALFRTAPIGELFRVLDVVNAKDAVRKARLLLERRHAAQ